MRIFISHSIKNEKIVVTVQNPLGFNDQLLCKTEN